jgi:hypothetical protein
VHQSPLRSPRRTARARLPWRSATAALAAILLAGTAVAVAAVAAGPASATAALAAGWYESAPYYSTLDSATPDLGQVMAATAA